MKLLYSLIAAVALTWFPDVANGAIRGFHEDKEDIPEVRQLMMGGGGSGGASGSMSAPPGCPNLMKGRELPSQYTACTSSTDCVAACVGIEDCCCIRSNNPGPNWCGWKKACNEWGQCVDGGAVSQSANDIKIYSTKDGDEVIETGNVKVSVAQNGKETIEILSHKNEQNDHATVEAAEAADDTYVYAAPMKAPLSMHCQLNFCSTFYDNCAIISGSGQATPITSGGVNNEWCHVFVEKNTAIECSQECVTP